MSDHLYIEQRGEDSLEKLEDAQVWALFLKGNEASFRFIYERHFDSLYNYGCQFTGDQMIVEDAIQELFIELRKRASFLSHTDKIRPYLMKGLRRKLIRMLERSRKLHQSQGDETFQISVEEQIVLDDQGNERSEKLKSALNRLSPKHREAIYHFYYENLSYEEIQDILAFENVKSVRNLIYKAVKELKKHMLIPLLLYLAALVGIPPG